MGEKVILNKVKQPRVSATPRSKPNFRDGLGYQLRITHQLIRRLLALKIEGAGVTVGIWYFLRVLWEEDGLTQRELADRTGTQEPSTLAAILQMEKRALVRRVRNRQDKRKINVFLTDKSLQLLQYLLPVVLEVLEIAKGDLSKQEMDLLMSLLKRIQQNTGRAIDALLTQPPPKKKRGRAKTLAGRL